MNRTKNDPEETSCALCLYPQVARRGGSGNTVLSRHTQIPAPTASGVQPPIMTPACPNSVTTSRSGLPCPLLELCPASPSKSTRGFLQDHLPVVLLALPSFQFKSSLARPDTSYLTCLLRGISGSCAAYLAPSP